MKSFFTFLILTATMFSTSAQILNADSYGSKVDSTHHFKGLIDFSFTLRKQVDIILSFGSKADFSYYYRQSLFVITGNFNLIRSGNQDLLNSGFAHTRIRFKKDNWLHPELFGQYQLDGVRGMERRVLVGGNLRFIIKEYEKGHLHFGAGTMYEYEKWNYTAVPSTITVLDKTPVQNHFVKMNLYLSYTQKIKKIAYFQVTAFFQTRPDSYFVYPRLSVNGMITFNFSKHIHFSIRYDVFYDALPVVPIDNLYFSVTNKLSFTF